MVVNHILSAKQFDKKSLGYLFSLADQIKDEKYDKQFLKGKIMATLFYEPSTRTRLSFEAAMQRLGGQVIATESAGEFSSAAKGETLADTIRVVNSYCDVIVLRHPNSGASQEAARFSRVPIINAGDGDGEHPTQALLDLYTINKRCDIESATIVMVGDLKYGRTIHSLSYLLSLYPKVRIIFVSPKDLAIPQTLRRKLQKQKTIFSETENFQETISKADIIYMTRIQKERFKNQKVYQQYFGKFILNAKNLIIVKKKAFIMHPLPRVNEIDPSIDNDRRAIYFEQAQNGLIIRMALLISLFDKHNFNRS